MTLVKQGARSEGFEYLRAKVEAGRCFCYMLCSLGTCLSNSFKNTSRNDVQTRLRALHAQFFTLLRCGSDSHRLLLLWELVGWYWGTYKA